MPKAKRAKEEEQIAIEASSGNVFEDLGLPDAGERLAKAELARVKRIARRPEDGGGPDQPESRMTPKE